MPKILNKSDELYPGEVYVICLKPAKNIAIYAINTALHDELILRNNN